ncbi:MAG: D-alanine--D-alanine ligase [Anaerocolumna sp.]|nr:D-alanine--D-alanine ligase [Anaerocolumna sp.]
MEQVVEKVESTIQYPVFIKPSNAGSSRGISKATKREELIIGLKIASEHDKKILVEEGINGREVECAVLGGNEPKASGVGEILAAMIMMQSIIMRSQKLSLDRNYLIMQQN